MRVIVILVSFFVAVALHDRKDGMHMKNIHNTPLKELVKEINRMLKGNPKAIQCVYAFLIGFTGEDCV